MARSGDSRIRKSLGGAAARPAPAELEAARRNPNLNFGRTLLLEELGHGGMGVVYRAWQEDLQRMVAVKVLPATAPEHARQRFSKEARLASKLRHPNIVTVHEMGEHQRRPWFSMDLVEGGSLDALIRGRKLPVRRLMEILRDVARALDAAHAEGVVHRDIKPANILLGADGTPFLSDFGLAGDLEGAGRLTLSGVVMGTPAYMSPEQARGSHGRPDPRTDIYSLGAVMYEGLTGHTVVPKADIVEMVKAVLHSYPEAPTRLVPSVHRDAETICLKCLQKDPDRRYRTPAELADDLDRFLAGEAISARPSTLFERLGRSTLARPPVLAGLGAAVLLVGAIVWLAGRQSRTGEELKAKADELDLRAREIADLKKQLKAAKTAEDRERIEREIAAKAGSPAETPSATPAKTPPKPPEPEPVRPTAPPKERRVDALEGELVARLARREFAAALAAVDAFHPESAEETAWQRDALGRVRDAARAAFEAIDARARALLLEGNLEGAVAEWETTRAFGIEEFDRLSASRIEEARAAVAAGRRDRVLPLLGPLRDSVCALCARRKYDDALKEIAALEKKEPALAADLAPVRSAVEDARSLLAAAEKGAAASKGRSIALKAGKGEIVSASGGSIEARIEGKAVTTVAIAELPSESLVELALAGGATPESVGAFRLFEGRPDLAAKAWASSPRRAELDSLAAAYAAAILDREARAALEELFKAAEMKDWKRCRELLALREKYGATAAWAAVAEKLEDIAWDAAERRGDGLFATQPRKVPSGLEWRCDFRNAESMRDWRMSSRGLYSAPGKAGIGWEAGAATVTHVPLEFVARLSGETTLTAEVLVRQLEGDGLIGLSAGGCEVRFQSNGYQEIRAPGGRSVVQRKFPILGTGKAYTIQFSVSKGKARACVDGRETLSGEFPEPLDHARPAILTYLTAACQVRQATVSGQLAPGWEESEQARRALLDRALRPSALGRAVEITDGRSLGLFVKEEAGTWDVKDGALLGTSPSDNTQAQLHYHGAPDRNFFLRFSYMAHSGRAFELTLRGGLGGSTFCLPTDRTGTWRTVEVVAAEEAVRCVVDGLVRVPPEVPASAVAAGKLRFSVKSGSISIRDVQIQEVRGLPQGEDWTVLFDRKLVPELRAQGLTWDADGEEYDGQGTLEYDPRWQNLEAIVFLDDSKGATVSLEARGERVVDVVPRENEVFLKLRVSGTRADAWLNGEILVHDAKAPRAPGPLRLRVSGKDVEVCAMYVRPLPR